ncbi:carbohydrate kinase family protein [uncultured Muribaculum sp.]|uniref:carbohydrate kinase family protein n=1 Tax=uncultured Muribaculum sp. TaxID=1918613 RepID=UPI0025F66DE0|nr:PfkB family carbohydrate kinase [uncultured Muribaculum sp.]
MRKIIIIGESTLRIDFDGAAPRSSAPDGVLLNTAAALGSLGHPVSFVSEIADDHVGKILLRFLDDAGVDTHSVDTYTGGATQLKLAFADGTSSRYGSYHDSGFTVVWPRIDPDDILLFGGNYALDHRSRPRLFEIVKYARERRATVIYVPDFEASRVRNITHLMPAILESFEAADMAVTTPTDLQAIFNTTDAAAAFRDHISFYTDTLLDISPAGLSILTLPSAIPLPPLDPMAALTPMPSPDPVPPFDQPPFPNCSVDGGSRQSTLPPASAPVALLSALIPALLAPPE